MKIAKKSLLIEILSTVQVVCLAIALMAGFFWARASIQKVVRRQIMEDNKLLATQMSKLIERTNVASLEYGTADWNELQTLIEEVSLPNDGYMCVSDRKDGRLVCHPKMRVYPSLRDYSVSSNEIAIDGRKLSLQSHVEQQASSGAEPLTGLMGRGSTTEVVSVSVLPSIDGVLMVHQSEKGFRSATNAILLPIGLIYVVVGFSLIWVTKKASVGVLNRYENKIAEINEGLEETVRVRTRALTKTRDAVIFGLAKLSESRDNDTGEHLERICHYATILARNLARLISVDEKLIQDIGLASSLHDIGKVGVQDRVLLKPGRLTPEERRLIEVHPRIGQECLEAIESQLGEDNFLSLAREICAFHHEKWDGSGYPHGLVGTDIPLSARIVALADVYDALRSRRPYKEPMSHSKARQIIFEGRAKHFDPDVVDAFLLSEAAFEEFSENQSRMGTEANLEATEDIPAECCPV